MATNVLSKTKASELCSAVYHWLSYEAACHRTQTLYEAALRTPVASYLNTVIRINSASGRETTVCEEDHPLLKKLRKKNTQGTNPAVDVAVKTNRDEWKLAAELKWYPSHRRPSPTQVEVDLHRLALIVRSQTTYARVLVVAGSPPHVAECARNVGLPLGGDRNRTNTLTMQWDKFWKSKIEALANEYKEATGRGLPEKIETRFLAACSAANQEVINDSWNSAKGYACAAWSVQLARGRPKSTGGA